MKTTVSDWRRMWVLVSLTLLVFAVLPAVHSSATSGTMNVDADTTLAEDHDGDIVITADNVTLDCDGHSVSGTGSGSGILLDGRSGVTVKNCDVSVFNTGINLSSSSDNTLMNNDTHHNARSGVTLTNSSDNTVTDSRSHDNGAGQHATFGFMVEFNSHNNTFTGNEANDNGEVGFATIEGADGNHYTNNKASGGKVGFSLEPNVDNNTYTGNTVSDSGGDGFTIGGTGHSFVGNVVENSNASGFALTGTGITFTDNESHGNGFFGFDDIAGRVNPTANSYSNNLCVRNNLGGSNPVGLCHTGGTFTDDDGNTFEVDIEWMRREGITLGCNPAGTLYCPNAPVTRAQMASFLVRALDLPPVAGNRFTDVSGTHTANINALAEAGVTLGCNAEGTLYCPNDRVTREQMGSFLARALDLPPVAGNRFTDVSGSHTANINAIAEAEITLGCNPEGTLYCPRDFVTRGQMAAFLHRALG